MSNRQSTVVEPASREDKTALAQCLASDRVEHRKTGSDVDDADASTVLDEDIAHLIRRAHQRASATFMAVLTTHNLTPAQYFALARLREKGEVSQNLLGRMAAMDPATIQGVVKRLNERDLITRVPDPNDRRRISLRLTDQGVALIDGLRSGIEEMTSRVLAPLSSDEQSQLRDLLKRIV